MRLGKFIHENIKTIAAEWEQFAGTLVPEEDFSSSILRNSIEELLEKIIQNMEEPQSSSQQRQKSRGNTSSKPIEDVSEEHVLERIQMGISSRQLISEYRALRASVIRLWQKEKKEFDMTDFHDLTRFHEVIDEAITESEARYSQKMNQSRELFLGILAHDLRNPLNAISGAATLISRSSPPESTATLANQILISAGHMAHLITDLIELTRIKLGKGISLNPRKTNMHDLCLKAMEEMQAAHPDRVFQLEAGEDLMGEWDELKLNQVLSNLLGNAVQHGARDSEITVAAKRVKDGIELLVHNEGPPIPQKMLPKLFDRFEQEKAGGQPGRPQSGSLGLGLYIAKEIVVAHGGTIKAESSGEEGTTISAFLPQNIPPDSPKL